MSYITVAEQLNRIEGWHENEITNNTKEFIKVEFYDLTTNDTLLRLPFRQRRQPCSCLGYNCGCCAGMNIVQFGFNQKRKTNIFIKKCTVYFCQRQGDLLIRS